MDLEIWELEKKGRKIAKRVTPGNRNEILDYLYRNKTAETEEIANILGKDKYLTRTLLKKMAYSHLIREVGPREVQSV